MEIPKRPYSHKSTNNDTLHDLMFSPEVSSYSFSTSPTELGFKGFTKTTGFGNSGTDRNTTGNSIGGISSVGGIGSAGGTNTSNSIMGHKRKSSIGKRGAIFSLAPADENDEDSFMEEDNSLPPNDSFLRFGGFAKTPITKREPQGSGSGINKLMRVYSENESKNFSRHTGERLYDDEKHRPFHQSNYEEPDYKLSSQTHVPQHSSNNDSSDLLGLEDEYIPGLDFRQVLNDWIGDSASQNTFSQGTFAAAPQPLFNSSNVYTFGDDEGTNSQVSLRETSHVNLSELHAQVAPIAMTKRSNHFRTRDAMGEALEPRTTSVAGVARTAAVASAVNKNKPEDVDYDAIYAKLPSNFGSLPFSVRRKTFMDIEPLVDYSLFSLYLKKTNKRPKKDRDTLLPGSLSSSSRFSSAASLFNTSPQQPAVKKQNVDERGAMVLGHELGRVIGCGAWGFVRECVAPDGLICAIKIVKTKNPTVKQHFRKEMELWGRLNHPNILPLLDHTETEHIIFCITTKVYGGTLFEVTQNWGLYNNPISFISRADRLAIIKTVAVQMTGALRYMHEEQGIVHGDLKLENCLVEDANKLTTDPKIILCDFGMSQLYTKRNSSRRPSIVRSLSSTSLTKHKSMIRLNKVNQQLMKMTSNSNALAMKNEDWDTKFGMNSQKRHHGDAPTSTNFTPVSVHSPSYTGSPNPNSASWMSQASIESQLNFPQLLSQSLLDIYKTVNAEVGVLALLDPDLPHSHIGSLPYASPELLLPSPPPLGPLADCWAFGVMLYTMAVGKLPFQHSYEPRLRAMISAGKFDTESLEEAVCIDGDPHPGGSSIMKIVTGCLQVDIVKRWDITQIEEEARKA
ncbi:hypothetical protein BABINDRAFT_159177 [Babjeviella inositovora NRRL Y-12698]|uniref:non-specific serine/threonine protein kinase n=1 Tax=Babjeviella inositovora NRRL Y-12698 TaxID=984486 RepID=A0A1E3QYD8_9ASCO|nr:uncharacterized protein BABINDRAFT_159177 [Babjeviella inositovora NRRL Y-12698]ODQ82626.1 hypothetical protein BABINDRAFT_159177 [Babjeviella inositovora NRRL Y-12698]